MFVGPLSESIIKRAVEKNILQIEYIDIRNFGIGKHKTVDDTLYGGGPGMLLRVDVLKSALDSSRCKTKCNEHVILLDPKGEKFSQEKAETLSQIEHLILVCPHYEGVDERFRKFVDEELSIGDYVLTGGEIPAMAIIDATVRLVPDVLGKKESSQIESFQKENGLQYLEHPQYTKPEEFEGLKVPEILLSGNHKKISNWKKDESLKLTKEKRPDLVE